jgi:hypothetical protein
MATPWQQCLVKDRFDAELLTEIAPHCSTGEVAGLATVVTDEASLKALEAAVAPIARKLPNALRETLREELAQIRADNRWLGTKRGRYVMAVNLWLETFHREFRSRAEFAKVQIGAHTEKEVVCIAGSVRSQQVLDELLTYVASKNPPYKLLLKAAIDA